METQAQKPIPVWIQVSKWVDCRPVVNTTKIHFADGETIVMQVGNECAVIRAKTRRTDLPRWKVVSGTARSVVQRLKRRKEHRQLLLPIT